MPAVDGMSDQDLLRCATEFDLGCVGQCFGVGCLRVFVRRCEGHRMPMSPMWKVVNELGYVLGQHGDWLHEPQPSSRNDAFYAEYRYATLAEAFAAVRE